MSGAASLQDLILQPTNASIWGGTTRRVLMHYTGLHPLLVFSGAKGRAWQSKGGGLTFVPRCDLSTFPGDAVETLAFGLT